MVAMLGAGIPVPALAVRLQLAACKLVAAWQVTADLPRPVLVAWAEMQALGGQAMVMTAMSPVSPDASAASQISTSAFNQTIVQGANVLGNTVDMTVVGGSFSSSYIGDDGDGV